MSRQSLALSYIQKHLTDSRVLETAEFTPELIQKLRICQYSPMLNREEQLILQETSTAIEVAIKHRETKNTEIALDLLRLIQKLDSGVQS